MYTPLYFAKKMDLNSQPYNNKWTRAIKQTLLNGLEIRSQKKQKKSSDNCKGQTFELNIRNKTFFTDTHKEGTLVSLLDRNRGTVKEN